MQTPGAAITCATPGESAVVKLENVALPSSLPYG